MSLSSLSVGFVGLGNIGSPMAANILSAGFPLTVYDKLEGPLAEFAELGAKVAASPAAMGSECDVIGICVRDDAEVESVVHGPQGLFEGVGPGVVVAVHSTVRPATVKAMGEAAAVLSVDVIDAPITGGRAGAEAKTLCCMVGGNEAAIERCRPVFETSAAKIVKTGVLGTGAAMKLCNNILTYLGFLAVSEANGLAEATGLSRDALLEVTRAGGVMTAPMEAFLGLKDLGPGALEDESFRAMVEGFRGLADKDLGLALESAAEAGLELPGARACRELMAKVYGLE